MPNSNTEPRRRRLGSPPALAILGVLLASTWCRKSELPDLGDVGGAGGGNADGGLDAAGQVGTASLDGPSSSGSDVVSRMEASTAVPDDAGIAPPPPPPTTSAVLTFHNDNFRTGANLMEQTLDVASVRARGMVLQFTDTVDGEIDGQPLYVPGVMVNGGSHDVVYVTTLNNSVYAFDASTPGTSPMTSAKLWQVTLADPENPTSRALARGIYSTPVIDLPTNTMYLVQSTRNTKRDNGKLTPDQTAALDVEFFLVALDIRTGGQLRSKKLTGTFPKMDGTQLAFEARNHWCRPGLLLGQGSLYVACGMRSDEGTTLYHGWVFRYDANTFAQQGTFCTSPDVTMPGDGASIWQSGGGLAQDPEGNVYFITANGPADFAHRSYGDALVKLSTASGGLAFGGAFTSEGPDGKLERHDVDFGSGGALVLPDAPFVFGAGKTGVGYVLGRDAMTVQQQLTVSVNQYNPTAPVDIFWEGGPHMHGTPAYWRGPNPATAYLYTWGEQDYLRRHVFDLSTHMFDPSKMVVGKILGLRDTMPGGALSISANGTKAGTGIVWATLPGLASGDPRAAARFMAHDAETLEELWETTFPSLAKWVPPTIADGKAFLATGAYKLYIYTLGPPKP